MNNLYFEILAFFYILKDPSLIKNFNKRFFTEPTIVSIFDYAQDFVNQYKEEPTPEQLYELIKVSGKEEIGLDSIKTLWQNQSGLSKYSDDWLKTNISAWGKFRSFYTGLESTIAYVKQLPTNIAYTDSEMYINRASNIFNNGASFSVNTTEGHDFFDLENHIIKEEDTHSTGYKFMDLCLKGGFMKKGLYIIMGAPKVGKSQWLCNLAANSVKMGYNTIYITLEMSYQKVSNRIGSNLFNINIDDYQNALKDKNKMKQAAQSFHNGLMIPAGKFYLEEFPTSTATASDIENFVLKKEAELSKLYNCEFKFANVFIDYVNIMRDQRGNSGDNTYIKIKNIRRRHFLLLIFHLSHLKFLLVFLLFSLLCFLYFYIFRLLFYILLIYQILTIYHYNLVPFREIIRFFTYRELIGMKAFFENLFGNILAFVPFGFMMPILNKECRKTARIILLTFLLSLIVENIQLVIRIGSFDVDDLILNTLGGTLGIGIFHWINGIRRRWFGPFR